MKAVLGGMGGWGNGRRTGFEVEAYVRVFLLGGGVVVRTTFDTVGGQLASALEERRSTYTWTPRWVSLAEGVWGERTTERAARPATTNATVVKKPNTFCSLTRLECILSDCD